MAEYPAMPLWTDAYLGDTKHLTTIEHGAYLLLLICMWRSKGSLPNDDRLLARYAGLTSGQWKRIKPIIMEFFEVENERLFQPRLTDEYEAVRQKSKRQSDKAKARWLKTNKTDDAEASPRQSQTDASLNPNPYPSGGGGIGARENDPTFRERILTAIGLDSSGLTGYGAQMIGKRVDMEEAWRWVNDLGLDEDACIDVVTECMAGKQDGPPASFRYFTKAMQRLSGSMNGPALQAIDGGRNGKQTTRPSKADIRDAARALVANFR